MTTLSSPWRPQIDLQIVDVAALYQDEIRRAIAAAASASGGGAGSSAAAVPVLLLSADNGQIQQARSHGVPAVRLADAAGPLAALVDGSEPLTASRLREALAGDALAGASERASCDDHSCGDDREIRIRPRLH